MKRALSIYAKRFDEECIAWSEDREINLMYLLSLQNYANEMFKAREFIVLNDVYGLLGMPRTKVGCIIGWDKNCETNDGFIDFGIKRNNTHANFILDFNVDGDIVTPYL